MTNHLTNKKHLFYLSPQAYAKICPSAKDNKICSLFAALDHGLGRNPGFKVKARVIVLANG